MDEMVNDVVEEVVPTDEGTGEGLSDAEFDAMWDSDEGMDTMLELIEEATGHAETEDEEILAAGQAMYRELSPETAA